MTSETKIRRRGRRWAVIVVLVAAAAAVVWYVVGGALTRDVRARVVARLEQMTGGRVEVGSLTWNLSQVSITLHDLTIHGTEAASEPPYIHVDELLLDAKFSSLLSRNIGINRLALTHPAVHLLVYPDGSTNQPRPKSESATSDPVAQIFSTTIGELAIANGELFLNGKRTQLDLTVRDIAAQMHFDSTADLYKGAVSVQEIALRRSQLPPLTGKTQLEFRLRKNTMQVDSLKVESPELKLDASGTISEFVHPQVDLTYTATVAMPALAAVLNAREVRSGRLLLKGRITGPYDGYKNRGTAVAGNVEVRRGGMHVSGVNAMAVYEMDPSELSFNRVRAQLLGGSATGGLKIENWTRAQSGQGRFKVSGIKISRVIAALPEAPLPLEDLHLAGENAGTVDVSWKDSPAQAIAAFEITTTAGNASPAEVPVNANLAGSYRFAGNTLQLKEATATTPQMQIKASGRLSPLNMQLSLSTQGRNSSELRPLFAAGPLSHLPLRPGGMFAFDGTISGRLKSPVVEGRLELGDFTARLSLSETASAQGPELHWDHFAGLVHYAPQVMWVRNAVLQRGTATANISAEAGLTKGKLEKDSAIQAQVSAKRASVADLDAIFGVQYPMTGELNAQFSVSGTRDDLHGNGSVNILHGSIRGEPFDSLSGGLFLTGQQIQASHVVLRKNAASVTGEGSFNLTSKEFRFKISGQQIHLAELRTLQTPKHKVVGDLAFQAEGSGSVEHPVLNAKLVANRVEIDEQAIGALDATLTTAGRELTVKLRSNFTGGDISADGKVRLSGDFPLEMSADFQNVNLTPVAQIYLQRELPGTALIAGQGHISGPLRTPRLLNATIAVNQFKGTVEQITVQNEGPWQIAYQDQALAIRRFHITGEGTNLTASGGVDLKGDTNLDLHASGQANLRLLRDTIPGLRSYGAATMEVAVRGTVARPNMSGRIQVSDAGINFIDLPNGLSDVNGTFVFNENRLQIQQLRARTGGGDIDITGFVAYRNGIYFELGAQGQEIRFRYPEGISSNANANLRLAGTLKNALLSGDVTVTRFTVTPKFDLAVFVANSRQPTPAPLGNTMLDNIRLDVHVTTTPELHVETSLAKLSAEADVHVRGNLARPVILGRVNIVEGDIFFNGTKYHLERGDISFTNPVKTEPVLNVEASARVRSYDITLGFHGSVNKLSTTYRSEPPLPTGDIIALLALGHTRDETDITQQQPTSMTETASNAILGQALNYALSNRVQKLFGVSRIKIDPMVGGPDNSSARVTIEQQVNNNVTLTYITNLAQSSQQVIQAEFTFNRDISLVVVRDQNGVLGFDLRLRQRLK